MCCGYVCVWVRVCTCACIPENTSARGCAGAGDILWLVPTRGCVHRGAQGPAQHPAPWGPRAPHLAAPTAPPQGLPGPNSSGVILVMFSPKPSAVLFYLFIYFALISSPLHCLMSPGKNYFPPPKKKERKKSIMEKKVNSRCQERTKEHPWLCAKPRARNVPFPPGNGLIPPQIF